MAAVAAVVFFAIAILMHLFGWGHGHIDETLFMLAGMLCLAIAAVAPGWPRRR